MCINQHHVIWATLAVLISACTNYRHAESQTTPSAAVQLSTSRTIAEGCEDCELMFVGIPDDIASSDTTEGWYTEGQRLVVRGIVFQSDKTSPARDIILYYYHTDKSGRYTPNTAMPSAARRHGYLRGWVKTGPNGQYAIYTNRPAQYPGEQIEAHIHVIVKEPDRDKPYWIDGWIFADDPLVTPGLKARLENRGGDGILSTRVENDIQIADHNVYLGLNIPGYPEVTGQRCPDVQEWPAEDEP